MFYKELENIYEKEKYNDVKTVIALATYLVNTYHIEKEGKLYKKELIIKVLTNVLGHLILKYQTYEYIQNNNINDKKYNKNFKPQLLFPMNNGLYTKNKYDSEKYKFVYQNIKQFELTRRNKNHVIEILKLFNICTVSIGKFEESKTTTIILNHYFEWRTDIFERSIEFNLQFYLVFSGKYLIELLNPDLKKKELSLTYIKKEGKKIPTSQELENKTNQINELWSLGLEKYYYKRIFIENVNNGGRFYSKFTNIPKLERKKLILESLNYVEIDFIAFVPNTMKMFVDGESYEERPYNKVSKFLIKSKYRNKKNKEKKEEALESYEQLIADIIKKPILIMLNQDFYTEENINQNKAVWKILIEYGLANTIDEIRDSTYYGFNAIQNAKSKHWDLYQFRETRWDQKVKSDVECPHFIIKPSNLLNAIKHSLKDIDSFSLTSNWGWTQYIESQLLVRISNDLKEDGLLPLFVHDAFIVPESFYQKYKELSNNYLLEIVAEFKKSLLTDQVAIQINKEFDDLLKSKAIVRILVSRFKKNTKYSESEIKSLTIKIIKLMKKEIKSFEKKGINKFYYSNNKNNYWKLYWIVKDKIEVMLK